MAGQPTKRAKQGYTKAGSKAAAERKAVGESQKGRGIKEQAETAVPDSPLSDNPVWQAYEASRQVYLAQLRQEAQEWKEAQEKPATKDMALQVIAMMHHGHSLLEAAKGLGYNYSAVAMAIHRDAELTKAANSARENYAHDRVRRMYEVIRQEPDPAKARVMADAIKWEVSKVLPKFYGDKLDIQATDKVTFSLNLGTSPSK